MAKEMDVYTILDILSGKYDAVSLDLPIGEKQDATVLDIVQDDDLDVSDKLHYMHVADTITDWLYKNTKALKYIFGEFMGRYYNGYSDEEYNSEWFGRHLTLEEIGNTCYVDPKGQKKVVSREMIRIIKDREIKKFVIFIKNENIDPKDFIYLTQNYINFNYLSV